MLNKLTQNIITLIKNIPKGKVISYGKIAFFAGNPNGARQVVRILHSCSQKYDLPWHRVVNAKLQISFKDDDAISEQRVMLEKEGVRFSSKGKIEKQFLWQIDFKDNMINLKDKSE
ncbi:MAG: MGMT family protein [Candidatus Cloacimonadota bacterium]|nr:MGMT family protein [Candidatus Cloacimonadota bacterium]